MFQKIAAYPCKHTEDIIEQNVLRYGAKRQFVEQLVDLERAFLYYERVR